MTMTHRLLQAILAPYSSLNLDCDGFMNLVVRILADCQMDYQVYCGTVTCGNSAITPHFWVAHQDHIIDLGVGKWLPSATAGIFDPAQVPQQYHHGRPVEVQPISHLTMHIMLADITPQTLMG